MRSCHLLLVLALAVVACSKRAPFSPLLVPAAGASGTLASRCAATDNPSVLRITCRVEESLR
jgi:hypothetical protein